MTLRLSTGLRNALVGPLGLTGSFCKFIVNIYSGSQPVSGDAAATGTLLGTVTLGSGASTPETQAAGSVTVTGSSGTISALTVGGFDIIGDCDVSYNLSAVQTAADLCSAINRNGVYSASVAGAVVTVKPRPGVGASHNGYVVSASTTLTCTYVNMSGGINAANGLSFFDPASGAVNKPAGVVWGFTGAAAGVAGWFRCIASYGDSGALATTAPWPLRIDGAIATSGAEMALSNIVVSVGSPNTVDVFSFTAPAQ